MNKEHKLWTSSFIIVSASNFLLFIGFYMLMVILAIYAIDQFQASQSQAGLASSIFVLGAVLVRPISGKIIETVGAKKLLLFGLSLFLVMMLTYFPINNLLVLFIVRFIHGFSFGISTTATGTIAANIIPIARRGEGMGYYATSTNLAMAIGPFLALYIWQHFTPQTLFIVITIFSVIALIATLFLRVPKVERTADQVEGKKGIQLGDYFEKSTIPIAILVGMLGFIYSSIISFFSAYAEEINLVDAASYFFVMYAVFLMLSRPFTGRLFDRRGENIVIYASLILFGIGFIILSQVQVGLVLLLSGAVIGVGFGTFQSSAQTVAINEAPNHRLGLATATYFVFFDFGIGVGPFLLGLIIPLIGFRNLYVLMAALVFFSMLVYYFVHGKKATERKRVEFEQQTEVNQAK